MSHQVVQVIPREDYTSYVYFLDPEVLTMRAPTSQIPWRRLRRRAPDAMAGLTADRPVAAGGSLRGFRFAR
jgi:hypothetical protein